ncbi:MAG: SDR family oxidoreductase [Pseudomonadota bacterium]
MSSSPHQRPDLFSLAGKTALITGASSGFGHHFAGVLAAAGANVLLGARRVEKIEDRVAQINDWDGGRAHGIALDVNDAASLERFLASALEVFGGADILVNNAGIEAGAKTYLTIDEDDWDAVLDTNLKSVWRLSKLYSEWCAAQTERAGNIINVSSITAWRTIKGQFPYAVSKAAVKKATEVMALEGARYGVRVNALAPGYFLTDLSRLLLESDQSEAFRKRIPQRRYGEFPDLDGALLLLASDASAYMTGSTIVIDGGHICAEL